MRFSAQTTLCSFTILVAAEGSGIAQLRYRKRAKAVSLPKNRHIFLIFPRGVGWGASREKRKIDVSCGQNRYAKLPLVKLVLI